jgi:photosynthetic reaction center cytochrome c subunit
MKAWGLLLLMIIAAGAFLAFGPFERPPMEVVQRGYRGLGMEQVVNPRTVELQLARNQVPEPQPVVEPVGTPAREIYSNVQVLGDLDADEFNRLMVAITEWVSPEQGCSYCHAEGEDLSSDSLYTKVVSRRMLQMTQHINANWKTHVGDTGVTCYTCHRGRNVPENIWYIEPGRPHAQGALGDLAGQNGPGTSVGLSSLPSDPFTPFLADDAGIRVVSQSALPEGNRTSIKQTEWTYGLMMHMSTSLGVNCTYCHNSRSFMSWDQSNPARASAWYGIRMTRQLNTDYLIPLGIQYPHVRLGPLGDAPKTNCATCHQGVFKPLYGVGMLKDYPELGVAPQPAAGTARTQ